MPAASSFCAVASSAVMLLVFPRNTTAVTAAPCQGQSAHRHSTAKLTAEIAESPPERRQSSARAHAWGRAR
eukprot:1984777-Prymnesium_polylepis.1